MKEVARYGWVAPIVAALNLAGIAVVASLYWQVATLDETWRSESRTGLQAASLLTQIERKIGYVGFIHHFKNFVLRRDEIYLSLAEQAHVDACAKLQELRETELGQGSMDKILAIEATLDEYANMLEQARDPETVVLSAEELDRLVRVSDDSAASALASLRSRFGSLSEQVIAETTVLMASTRQRITTGIVILTPLVLLLTLLLHRSLYRSWWTAVRYRRLFLGSPDGILLCNATGRIVEVSPRACEQFGYEQGELEGRMIEDLVPRDRRDAHVGHREAFMRTLQQRPMGAGLAPLSGVRKDGSELSVQVTLASQEIEGERMVMAVVRDVTMLEQLRLHSRTDHLTELHNRRSFESALEEERARNSRYRHGLALLLVDLDHFKKVNDERGHAEGDEVLRLTASFLLDQCRATDVVGRWGGDEFVVICPEIQPAGASELASRLAERFEVESSSRFFGTTLSIGVVCVPPGTETPSTAELLARADEALYAAKAGGRSRARLLMSSTVEDFGV